MKRPRDDDGLAALELAIVVTLFTGLLSLVAPLAYMFYENLQLGRAAGDVIRFASSRSDVDRTVLGPPTEAAPDGATTVVPAGDLPSAAAVADEVHRAYTGLGAARLMSPGEPHPSGAAVPELRTVDVGTGCPSGRRVNVVVSTTVDLGPFLGLLFEGPTTRVLTAQATSCEE